jgi:hypothetical protein
MAHANSHAKIENPGAFEVSSGLKTLFAVLALVGLVAFGAGLKVDAHRTWAAFLQNHFFFMSLGVGGLFFAAIQWLTGAMWSAPLRRVSESFSSYLPFALIATVAIYFGIHEIYIWSHADHVKGDIVLEGKSGYLSQNFFMIRNVLAVAIWLFFGSKLIGNSTAQDATGDYSFTAKNRGLAPAFLALFGVTFTMSAFDQLMSLDPHWFSTMFGVYCFAGLFYSTLALTAILTVYLINQGKLKGLVNENHLHDLGKFMFAFTVFWAYIGFSQFMLIWYANLPEETGYFMHRMSGSWMYVSVFLLLGKFMTPFFMLLPRDAKRSASNLVRVGAFMMVAQWVDVLWIVQPEFFKDGPKVGWIELGLLAGFAGVFFTLVFRFFAKHNVVAIGDPRLAESVHHHHQ